MSTLVAMLKTGLAHFQAGRLDEAEQVFRQVLATAPQTADALHLLGLIARQRGQLDIAANFIEQALAINAGAAPFHNNLGLVRQAQGNLDSARRHFLRAIELRPDYAEGLNNLASCYQSQGDHVQSLAICERALAYHPQFVELWINRGNALQSLRRRDEALAAFQHAITQRPNNALAYGNLGTLLRELRRLDEAKAALETAVQLDPNFATAHSNLATVLRDLKQFALAEQSYLRAIELQPRYAKYYFNLANLLRDTYRTGEAEGWYRRAIELDPQLASVYINLGALLQNQGRLAESRSLLEQAIALAPDDVLAHNNRIMNESYQADATPERFLALLERFEQRCAASLAQTWQPHTNVVDAERPLRIGFVSADLGQHPIGKLMRHVFTGLDRAALGVYVYSQRTVIDDLTRQLQQSVDEWRDIADRSDEEVAAAIRADAIDILVDLSGHTAGHRLPVFARRPAPVQVTWMGFAASTGLRAIDWLLTDAFLVPPECDGLYRERVWRLPHSAACYDLPLDAPDVQPPPSVLRGFVTFGCFNNLAKLTDPTLAAWARILAAVPHSRLLLKYEGLHEPAKQRITAERLTAAGVDPARVEFEGMTPYAAMLARYHDVDVALDPFPYTGGTTSILAVWMGVPVVTLVGQTLASRQTYSILANAGVTETVTHSLDDYVATAIRLARDPARLVELRRRLRPGLAASSFGNAPRFVADLSAALRGMWRAWCSSISK